MRRASTAIELIARMSCTRSTTRPGRLYEWKKSMSPIEPSVIAGQKIGMRLWISVNGKLACLFTIWEKRKPFRNVLLNFSSKLA